MRRIETWLAQTHDALAHEAARDPFVSGALHAAQAFGLPEREFFLTLVRALSAERERLVGIATRRIELAPPWPGAEIAKVAAAEGIVRACRAARTGGDARQVASSCVADPGVARAVEDLLLTFETFEAAERRGRRVQPCGGSMLVPQGVPREMQRACPGCGDCEGRR